MFKFRTMVVGADEILKEYLEQNEEAKTIYMLSGNQLEEEIQRELDEGYETYLNKQKTRIRKKYLQ